MKRILVVDDDRSTRRLIRALLEKDGYAADEAGDGAAALRQLGKRSYSLILLDVWMPGLSGLDVLGRIRKKKNAPPVVVMTTDEAPETMLRAVREQAYQYMGKPVEPDVLHDVVAEALAHRKAPPITVISARPNWVELLVPCQREAAERIHSFLARLKTDLPEPVRESVGQAFRELLLNAVEWGGKLDPKRRARIAYVRTERMLLYRIADPGPGFQFQNLTHSALSNTENEPFRHTDVREEKGLRPGGYGILMTRAMVDELVYNEAQNEVLFVKYLS